MDGHGNFGSIDGDSAAAMRYTEVRLQPLAMEMLRDIVKSSLTSNSPPDGKSGALIYSIKFSREIFGFSMYAHTPSITSVMLCGGIFVAKPTAIPDAPLTKRLGNLPGKVLGSYF